VQRGEILLSLDCLRGWQQELRQMNQGKNGRPFDYPHSLILFLGTLRVVFHLPYRQLEGLARGLKKLVGIPAPDYSTLSLRVPKLDMELGYEPKGEPIAVDATGIKVTNRGEWRRRKRKGYVKIHVAVDTKTKRAVSLEVSDERTHDSERLKPLVRGARRRARIRKVLGDGSYDAKEVFEFLGGQGIAAGIKVRQDSNPACEGARGEVVRAYLSDPEGWKQAVGYGQRWMAESFFSGFKRLFGEVVHAKKWERMVQELRLKVWVYNLLLGLTVGLTGTGAGA
jgi:hypothetical protein